MKKYFALMLALAMALSLAACGSTGSASGTTGSAGNQKSSEPIVISLSNAYSDMDQVNVELKTAAENIDERTDGAVKLTIYPNNTLGSPADAVEAIR